MITGVHTIIYSKDPERLRAFLRDGLKLPAVDAGGGWLIFASPPAELAAHPADRESGHELYFMCDDVTATLAELEPTGVTPLAPVSDQGWGLLTRVRLPSGDEVGLYQPRHPTALHLGRTAGAAGDQRP
jgi:catechol 2,3-dioxygenase-like lactoylglutathione lyase family enzyme